MDRQNLVNVEKVFVDLSLHLANQRPSFVPKVMSRSLPRLLDRLHLDLNLCLELKEEVLRQHLVILNFEPFLLEVLVARGLLTFGFKISDGSPTTGCLLLERFGKHVDKLVTCLVELHEQLFDPVDL